MSSNQKFRTATEISHYFKHRDIPANITDALYRSQKHFYFKARDEREQAFTLHHIIWLMKLRLKSIPLAVSINIFQSETAAH